MHPTYRIDDLRCTGCGACADMCPTGAITLPDGRARIDAALCMDCGSCVSECPAGAIMAAQTYPLVRAEPGPAPDAALAGGARRPVGELLPAAPSRSRFWPLVGGALIWAARELLPEVLAAWRTSGDAAGERASGPATGTRRMASARRFGGRRRLGGRRHRGGRAC